MIRTTSSYEINDIGKELSDITKAINPSRIVEIGIGNGYSLKCFAENSGSYCNIWAVDLFDEFPFNRADEKTIREMFKSNLNVSIGKGNFYECYSYLADNSIDIIHIDVANNGEVYEFAVKHYLPKIRQGGVMLLEGGSEERDSVEWMVKYNKRKINPYLKSISDKYDITIIDRFPSLTIINK
jgi:predicted O-methyltransferase YrrM